MAAADRPHASRVTPEQVQQLMQLHLELASARRLGTENLLAWIAERVRAVLCTRVMIATRTDRTWSMIGVPAVEPDAARPDADVLDEAAGEAGVLRTSIWRAGETPWTVAGVGASCPAVLLLEGDWIRSVGALSLLTGDLAMASRLGVIAAHARSRLVVHRLARSAAFVGKSETLHDLIIRGMAEAVKARIGALAAPAESGLELTVMATYGYRRELVEHLRIQPGVGVLGQVFQSGRPLIVRNVDRLEDRPRRARYRTASFAAVPIRLGPETLAVASVTDRRDNQPFTKDDASVLRALAAPAALALGRERAIDQAEQFAQSASIDPGSGAFNRRHLEARIEQELERSRRNGTPVSLVMLDIDDFKSINDSFGHLAGDMVIRDVAVILRRSVRLFDVCARFGGEEFAILMPGASLESATRIAARVRERIEAYRCLDPRLANMRVTASLGLAVSRPDMTPNDLLSRADAGLYLAKREGKNQLRALGADAPEPHPSMSHHG